MEEGTELLAASPHQHCAWAWLSPAAWRQLWRGLQNVWKVKMCLLYFASLSKIPITLEFREIILDPLNVWEANLLPYCIYWYKTLFLIIFSWCSMSSLCKSGSFILQTRSLLCVKVSKGFLLGKRAIAYFLSIWPHPWGYCFGGNDLNLTFVTAPTPFFIGSLLCLVFAAKVCTSPQACRCVGFPKIYNFKSGK